MCIHIQTYIYIYIHTHLHFGRLTIQQRVPYQFCYIDLYTYVHTYTGLCIHVYIHTCTSVGSRYSNGCHTSTTIAAALHIKIYVTCLYAIFELHIDLHVLVYVHDLLMPLHYASRYTSPVFFFFDLYIHTRALIHMHIYA